MRVVGGGGTMIGVHDCQHPDHTFAFDLACEPREKTGILLPSISIFDKFQFINEKAREGQRTHLLH